MPILTSADFPQVRALLGGAEVTAATLPETIIQMDVYQGAAEDWATARIPTGTVLTVPQVATQKRATLYYLAGLLAPVLPDYTMRRDASGTEEQVRPIDRREQQADLFALAEAQLADILGLLPATAGPMAAQFKTAGPKRRRW